MSSCEDLFVAWRREDDHVPKQRGIPKQHCESVTQWRLGKDAIASTLTFNMQVVGLPDSNAFEVAGGMYWFVIIAFSHEEATCINSHGHCHFVVCRCLTRFSLTQV